MKILLTKIGNIIVLMFQHSKWYAPWSWKRFWKFYRVVRKLSKQQNLFLDVSNYLLNGYVTLLMSYILVQKSIWRSPESRETCFEKAKLVHFISLRNLWSRLDQTCAFEQFECGPNLPFDTWPLISKRNKANRLQI